MPDRQSSGQLEAERLYARLLERLGLGEVTCAACARALLPAPFNWESYTYTSTTGGSWTWDIRCARSLVERRPVRNIVELGSADVEAWLAQHGQVDEQHLPHIPPERVAEPVLVAPVPAGRGHVMIDGSHRATIRSRAGLRVEAYVLSAIESSLAIGTVPLAMSRVAAELCSRRLLDDDSGRGRC